MANLAVLSTVQSGVTALSNLILATPQTNIGIQPQQTVMPNGNVTAKLPSFLFDFNGEDSIELETDITDHFTEDNSSLQDQATLLPEKIHTEGFVSELNDIVSDPILQALQIAAQKLTIIAGYTPQLSTTALLAYNEAIQAYQIGNLALSAGTAVYSGLASGSVQKALGLVPIPVQTKQQAVFTLFYGYWQQRQLFTVQTPWAIFQNMMLKNVRPVQGPDSNSFSTFQVTFKIMRFAGVASTSVNAQERNQIQQLSSLNALVNNGPSTGIGGYTSSPNYSSPPSVQ
jgi:hypothetical protein